MPNNNFELSKGDDRMIRVYMKDENLDILDLNGAEARFYLSESSKSSTYVIRKSTNSYSEGVIRTPERGEVIFFLGASDTKDLDPTQYYFQIVLILSNGRRYTACTGYMNLYTNLEYSVVIEPSIESLNIVEIPEGSASLRLSLQPQDVVFATLLAPSQTSENICISNLVYSGSGIIDVFFTATILEPGWKLSYFVSSLPEEP
ncbi:MAG: hypothetical protein M0P12_00700 [Paludibacteraceae bacterium]|nr:hypothetical protein [Paludibacteraceae bacterium]MCK9615947.1 hypothetical protein [Candidatus Omnitrophota bacterium]